MPALAVSDLGLDAHAARAGAGPLNHSSRVSLGMISS